jgi:hypothetical protein
MLGINQQYRRTKALESMARSSSRIAFSFEKIAEAERQKTGFLRWLFSNWDHEKSERVPHRRRYSDGGGLHGGALPPPPVGPIGPTNAHALPMSGDRPCINVTPAKLPNKGKERLW